MYIFFAAQLWVWRLNRLRQLKKGKAVRRLATQPSAFSFLSFPYRNLMYYLSIYSLFLSETPNPKEIAKLFNSVIIILCFLYFK
jgi:hypothetical protein